MSAMYLIVSFPLTLGFDMTHHRLDGGGAPFSFCFVVFIEYIRLLLQTMVWRSWKETRTREVDR